MLLKPREKTEELHLGIGSFGVLHRGAGIAEAPSRRECRPPRQRGEPGDNIAHPRAEHEIEVEIAIARFEAAVRPMIGVDFLAEVESAVREIVVKKPDGRRAAAGPDRDVKGNVFVKRVRGFGIVVQRISRAHTKASAMFVCVATLLAEAVIMIFRVADEIVDETRPQPLELIGLRLPVLQRCLEGRLHLRSEGPRDCEWRTADLHSHERGLD